MPTFTALPGGVGWAHAISAPWFCAAFSLGTRTERFSFGGSGPLDSHGSLVEELEGGRGGQDTSSRSGHGRRPRDRCSDGAPFCARGLFGRDVGSEPAAARFAGAGDRPSTRIPLRRHRRGAARCRNREGAHRARSAEGVDPQCRGRRFRNFHGDRARGAEPQFSGQHHGTPPPGPPPRAGDDHGRGGGHDRHRQHVRPARQGQICRFRADQGGAADTRRGDCA
jgi:hypothetical protein